MAERVIRAGDIDIWTEDFGDPSDPTILLIMGPAPGIFWPDDLCEDLAEGGRHVIRYDHRCIGRSSSVDFATDPYTISDMAADAVGVLDAYSVNTGHVVGFSGGGAIAQTVALEHPDRVASLTSWGASPLGTASFEAGDTLPGMDQKVIDASVSLSQAADDQERIDRAVELGRAFSGTIAPFDEEAARGLARRVSAQIRDPEAQMNYFLATAAAPDRTEALGSVTAPTLVIHGTSDPAVPLPHGEATARAIPGALRLTIEGMGHDFPHVARARIVSTLLEHTAPVEARR